MDVTSGRPDWLHSFQAWAAGLSPETLADVLDVLAAQLRERDIGDHDALGKVAETVRVHHATRVQQLVDAFLVAEPGRALPRRSSGPI
jgi:hypothetical protein